MTGTTSLRSPVKWRRERSRSSSASIRLFQLALGKLRSVGDAVLAADQRVEGPRPAVFRHQLKDAGMLMVSHSTGTIRAYCRSGLVLEDGEATYFEDVEDAIAQHERNMALT